jgi:hypothetical protein
MSQPPLVAEHFKETFEDKQFLADVCKSSFHQHQLSRVYAVDVAFTDVSFKQAVLSACYFRNCTFMRCDFTGASFKDSNLRGCSFSNCKFSYTTWEKTVLDEEFLASCLPAEENLARDLVRSLRVNFAQIGNHAAVNKAAAIEVDLTGRHLFNAAYSKQAYHRKKYSGLLRIEHGAKHAEWKFLDLLWGNGESILKVSRSCLAIVVLGAIAIFACDPNAPFGESVMNAFLQFWGLPSGSMPQSVAILLTMSRYILFGLFMAILVKRLSRR